VKERDGSRQMHVKHNDCSKNLDLLVPH
jgi:hypothetical protein